MVLELGILSFDNIGFCYKNSRMTTSQNSSDSFPPLRLTMDDYWIIYSQEMGVHLPMQLVMISNSPIDRDRAERINAFAMGSSFSRGLYKSELPFAPNYWGTTHVLPAVLYTTEEITDEQISPWLDEQIKRLPEGFGGPGWLVSTANLTGGRSIVALSLQHYVCDGLTAIMEVFNLVGQVNSDAPVPAITRPEVAYRQEPYYKRVLSDLKSSGDFNKQLLPFYASTIGPRIAAKLESKFSSRIYPDVRNNFTLFFDAQEYKDVANKHGGTATTLTTGIMVNIAAQLDPDAECRQRLSIISNRRPEDGSFSNHATSVKLRLDDVVTPVTDLTHLRKKAKDAYKNITNEGAGESLKPSMVISPVGEIPTQIGDLVPGTQFTYARATPHAKSWLSQKVMRGITSFYTIYDGKIAVTFVNLGIKELTPMKTAIDNEIERWGLTLINPVAKNS